ncbi:MAG: hypothetical protein J7501_17310, partial [Bdellovibrio sp.]|nr:hypothetical protein [Bdellovibrio sp.]
MLALIIVATLLSACSIAVKIQSQLASMNPIAPQVVLSTTQTDFTNSTWTIDVTSSENITLTPADFLVVNGTVSNLTQIDDKHWSLVIQPAGEGPVEVSVPAKVAQGSTSTLDNEASNTLSIVSDVTPPTATLSYLGTDPTNVSPLVINLVFDEPLAAAPTLSQILVTNGTASNLTGSGQVYSYEITPSGQTVTVSTQFIASQITDRAGNANTASNIVTVTFNSNKPFPTITSSASLAVNSPAITV